jgi:hypothetical protein
MRWKGEITSVPLSDFVIVDRGRQDCVINKGRHASPPEEFACLELQRYVRRISGANIRVLPEEEPTKRNGGIIYIGATERATNEGVRYEKKSPEDDGYVLQERKGNLFIVGEIRAEHCSAPISYSRSSE